MIQEKNKARYNIEDMNEGIMIEGCCIGVFIVPNEIEEFTIKHKKDIYKKFEGKITREIKENILYFLINSKIILKITGELFDRVVKIFNSIFDVGLNNLEYFICQKKERKSLLLIKYYGLMIVIAPRIEEDYG